MEGLSHIENILNPEEELNLLRNKISETFKAEGLTPGVYRVVEEWRSKKEALLESRGLGTSLRDSLEYQTELAELYIEIRDIKMAIDITSGLDKIWDAAFESEDLTDLEERLNVVMAAIDDATLLS